MSIIFIFTGTLGVFNKQSSHHGRKKEDGKWLKVSDHHHFYAFSAFYDNRTALRGQNVIRIISISPSENIKLKCVLYYKESVLYETDVHVGLLGQGVYHGSLLMQEKLLTCRLRSQSSIPDEVSIIVKNDSTSTPKIPIEIPENIENKANFVLCMSVTYWHHDPLHIVEWMELLQILGVDLAVIYNNSMSDESAQVFKYYDEQVGFVDFRQTHGFIKSKDERYIHLHMSPAINDCMYRNMNKFKKVYIQLILLTPLLRIKPVCG